MAVKEAKQLALRVARSSIFVTSALFFADGLWAKLTAGHSQDSEHLSGVNIDEDFRYAGKIADLYLAQGKLKGRVAEIGPGGNAAVALNLLASGAESVDLLDRFIFTHDEAQLDRLYRRFDNYGDLSKVRFHTGESAAAERFFQKHRGFDAILSCAVLEHLSDPAGALKTMVAALQPGGRMVHQVDLRDHGMFTAGGKHELTFLTIPDAFYRVMSEPRGRPNRVPLSAYRRVLEESPVDYRILVTHLVGVGELPEPKPLGDIAPALLDRARAAVTAFRPKLIRRLRDQAVDDLAVAGFRIVATRRRNAKRQPPAKRARRRRPT
jgi:SAM-dependent methyltransferase